jgi:hypothetical protein
MKVLYKGNYYDVYHIDKGIENTNTANIRGEREYLRFLIFNNNEWTYVNAHDCVPKEF